MVAFNLDDLTFVLTQIKMAEAGQPPENATLPFGLRTVDGTYNSLVPGQLTYGAADQVFPTTTDPLLQNAQSGTSYASTSGLVIDGQPRTISNLIADQTADNPAALAAQAQALDALGAGYQNTTQAGWDGIFGTADDIVGGNLATPTDASSSGATIPGLGQSLFINNVTPDAGLSAPFSSWFTFFGQFFDHGLDLISKGGSGIVYIPLTEDDPLYVPGGHANFMVLTRATNQPGADGVLGTADDIRANANTITPFIDQSQTYSSHPSHQVFLREYMVMDDGKLHSTGNLLSHSVVDGHATLATWADLKANAATFLGIQLTDADVGNIPLLATDAYGNFLPGAHGLPQLVVRNADGTISLVEGDLAHPISTAHALRIGVAFINDMAHSASPTDDYGNALRPDMDAGVGNAPASGFYDNELLDAHYVAGDGRVNENIGLTSVQNIFHAEHNRLVAQIKALIQSELDNGNTSFPAEWVVPGTNLTTPGHVIKAEEWNGERLFQAAKFAEETEYQHLALGEFARMVDPAVHLFGGFNVHLDPAITSEFANVVYRFGHSMLDENINIYEIDPATGRPVIDPATGQPVMTEMGLIQAFTNPLAFAADPNATANIVLGSINQVGNEIDEFVTGSLRDNLLGLPLDLGALNIARGRDAGVAPLNLVRQQLFTETGDGQLKPYSSWDDFGHFLKHPESLVNFVAAYGTHGSITGATTLAAKRAAAADLVHAGTMGDPLFDPTNLDAYNFMHSLGAYRNDTHDARAIHDAAGAPAQWSTGSVTGLDKVDLWIGGLAEKQNLFGSLLGSTFEFIFRIQMENLQDGDRLYYLPRTEGMHFNTELEAASFAEIIRDNTGIKHLPGNVFRVPEYTVEASDYFQKDTYGNFLLDEAGHRIATDPSTWLRNPQTGQLLVEVTADGTVHFLGDDNFLGNTIVLGGTEGDDRLMAGQADDDAIWGDGGDDYINGSGGVDFLYGGDGDDTVVGEQGDDVLHAQLGDDSVSGGDGLDLIFGDDGNDFLDGGRGDDAINGGQGNDIIKGGEGNDEILGNEGDDWIEGGLGGDLLTGDIGAPTGQTPLYDGNDVLIGGPDGGDGMHGFNGDDVMLGIGSFDKFNGGLGFDWASFEQAGQGVDADLTRREFIAANGAVDNIRDVFIAVEGVSGSAHDDILRGTNSTTLVPTKDALTNVSLINGLAGFFDPGAVTFTGGNIILGGAGNDLLIGGGGDDIIDGDAMLHVALTKDGPGAQIIRQIVFDPNGNTWDPLSGTGHANAINIDTAVFNDILGNYNVALFGPDAEGFLSIQHIVPAAGAPAAAGVIDDGTDRIRHVERLQFADMTVAIDANGNFLNPFFNDPNYDAVPIGGPVITETAGGAAVDPATTVTIGSTLTADASGIFDADGITGPIHFQWQVLDILRAVWVPVAGATNATFVPTTFQDGQSIRVQATYIDGKGYQETVNSVGTALTTLAGNVNTPPFLNPQQQLNGIQDTTSTQDATVDFFVPVAVIFNDKQTAPAALVYTATLADGSPLSSVGLAFSYDPATGQARFTGTPPAGFTGQLAIRVKATDGGPGTPLSVTDTFILNVLPANTPPVATNDSYSAVEGSPLGVHLPGQGVLANDTDADGHPLTAVLMSGPAHGTLQLNANGTFDYTPNANYVGTDSFTYAAADIYLANSNIGTATITVAAAPHVVTAALLSDTGASATDAVTSNPMLVGSGYADAAVFASIDGAAAIRVATADAAGAWSFTPILADGQHSIVISETSQTGHVDSVSVSLLVDTTVPAATVGLLADTGASAADAVTADPTLAGIGEPDSFVTLSFDGGAPIVVATDITGQWNYVPTLADGAHTVVVTGETDLAGNTGMASLAFTLDTTNPVVTGALLDDTGSSAADGITADATLTGSGDPGAAVFASIDGAAAVLVATADGTGAWQYAPVLADGDHSILVTETDLAGNVGQATVNLTLDTVTPTVTVALVGDTGASATDGITSNPALTGTADPNAVVLISFDGTAAVSVPTDAEGKWTYTPVLADGVHSVAVTGTDSAGNVGSEVLAFTLDTTVPGTPVLAGIAYTATTTAVTSYVVSGVTEPGSLVTLTNGGASPLGTATAAADGSWFVAVAPSPNANFATVLTQVAVDMAGNVSGAAQENLIVGTGGINTLTAASGLPSLILGLGGNDGLTGNGGNDTLDGGTGGDAMAGGMSDDTYVVDSALDVLTEAAGGGADTVRTTLGSYTLGAALENLTYIGAGGFAGTGNALANLITGRAGNDTLTGGLNITGGDTLIGGSGNDSYVVSNADDVVVEAAGGGTDTVRTALGSLTLGDNLENLIYTGAGNFAGTGNTQTNTITGGAGADTLDGGFGADRMGGGQGDDTYQVDTALDVLTEQAGGGIDQVFSTVSLTLGANLENLTLSGPAAVSAVGNNLGNILVGNAGVNVLLGNDGNDTLRGGDGNDMLNGGTGADSMEGGTGADAYNVDNAGDVILELAGGGTDEVRSSISYTLGANLENLTLSGLAGISGIGNSLGNILVGNAGVNVLLGNDGNDTLRGGDGNDMLNGGTGADSMEGGTGADAYNVDNAGDVILELAGAGTDEVRSSISYTLGDNLENLVFIGAGNFAGTGNSQANVITGGTGTDTLDGGLNAGGVDRLIGGAGNDTYIVRNVGDVVTEGANAGIDTVMTALGSFALGANMENLTFTGLGNFAGTGNALANVLTGGVGADRLSGGGGSDTLIGGAGGDVLTGGAGSDTFVLAQGSANGDAITDFARTGANGPDHILFAGYGAGAVLVHGVGSAYSVQVAGSVVDAFTISAAVTLTAGDYDFV